MRESVKLAWVAAAALLAASCTFYHVKSMDPKVLAGKGPKGQIVSVRTAYESYEFPAEDPAVVRDGAVLGNVHLTYTVDPFDIADISPGQPGPNVVLKDGTRFRAPDSRPDGEVIVCEALRTVCIPADEVVRIGVRRVDGLASVLGSIAGAALFVAALAVDPDGESWADDDDLGALDAGYRRAGLLRHAPRRGRRHRRDGAPAVCQSGPLRVEGRLGSGRRDGILDDRLGPRRRPARSGRQARRRVG